MRTDFVVRRFLRMVIEVIHPSLERLGIRHPLQTTGEHRRIVAGRDQFSRNVEDLGEPPIDGDDPHRGIDDQYPIG